MELLTNILICFISFIALIKSANYLLPASTKLAEMLGIPRVVIAIVLISFGTTAPEFAVSVIAAYESHPEIALGNAVGSVICDDGIALALAALIAPVPILIKPRIWKGAAAFLAVIYILSYIFAFNGVFARSEGAVLLMFLAGYFIFLIVQEIRERKNRNSDTPDLDDPGKIYPDTIKSHKEIGKQLAILFGSIAGIIIASHFVVNSVTRIAEILFVPKEIISLTIVAIGTSLPEITTCVVAARKGYGDIAVGNIIGADILNILWIIGASSVVNPIHVSLKAINFMFPSMIIIVGTMLICMRIGYKLGKPAGLILFSEYLIYLFLTIYLFY